MISTKGRYALRMAIDLAENDGAAAPLRDVAQRQGISEKYLEHVAKTLVDTGLIVGTRGKGGGYRLAKPPDVITALDVLEAAEGTLAPVACLVPGAALCPRATQCKTLPMWERYHAMLHDFFGSVTIASLEGGEIDAWDA